MAHRSLNSNRVVVGSIPTLGDVIQNIFIRDSIVASIPACHAGDRGSIPRRGDGIMRWWCSGNINAFQAFALGSIPGQRTDQNTFCAFHHSYLTTPHNTFLSFHSTPKREDYFYISQLSALWQTVISLNKIIMINNNITIISGPPFHLIGHNNCKHVFSIYSTLYHPTKNI